MKARIYRFLESDPAVAAMLLIIAGGAIGGSYALFEARIAGWL